MNIQHVKFLVLTIAITCLSVVPPLRAAEPSYNGKPLSEWLLVLKIGHISTGEQVEEAVAQEAIRQMGTNAIPTLLDILGATDANKRRVLSRLGMGADGRYLYGQCFGHPNPVCLAHRQHLRRAA